MTPNTPADELIANLHEANRHRRIRDAARQDAPIAERVSFDLPTFDCRDALSVLLTNAEQVWAFADRSVALARKGNFVLGRGAILIFNGMIGYDSGPVEAEWVVHIQAKDLHEMPGASQDAGWLATLFGREYDTTGKVFHFFGPLADGWVRNSRYLYFPTSMAVEQRDGNWGPIEKHPDHEPLFYEDVIVRALVGLIQTEPTFSEWPSGRHHQAVNAGRARGKLVPLPNIRVLQVNRTLYAQVAREHEATGREMPSHFRRAHSRTFRHPRFVNVRGQTREIPETHVRADKGDMKRPIYKVEI